MFLFLMSQLKTKNASLVDVNKIIPNKHLSINSGAISPISNRKSDWIISQIELIGKKYNFTLNTPFSQINQKGVDAILYGVKDS